MKDAGYDVTHPDVQVPLLRVHRPPAFSEVSPTPTTYVLNDDWNPGQSTGTATAALQPAGGIVIPPTPTPSSASGCTAADFSGFVPGRIALIQRGGCNFGVKVQNAQAAGATGVDHLQRGQPRPHGSVGRQPGRRRRESDRPDDPGGVHVLRHRQRPAQPVSAGGADRHALPVMNITIQAIVDPNARRLQRHRRIQGRRQEPRRGRRRPPGRDLRRGHARQRLRLRDDPGHRPEDEERHPRNKLRFIWFGGEELGLLGSAYYVNNLSSTELSHIGYDLDADVTATPNYIDRRPRSGGAGPVQRTVHDDVPEPRLQGIDGRAGSGDRLLRLDRAQPRAVLTGRNRRVQLQRRRNSRQRPADRAGLLQDPGRSRPVRRFPRELRGQHPELRRRMCRQPVPVVRQPEQQRSDGAHVHVEGVRQHGGPDGLRHEGDVREQQRGLQEEAADRPGTRPASAK